MGRKTEFTPEIAEIICDRIATGESLRQICKDDTMPSNVTVCKWLYQQPEFAKLYARAREDQADFLAEEIIEIADDSGFDAQIVDGKAVINNESVQRSRLMVDARKWYAGKVSPRKYGEKIAVGGDPDAPPIRTVSVIELIGPTIVKDPDPDAAETDPGISGDG